MSGDPVAARSVFMAGVARRIEGKVEGKKKPRSKGMSDRAWDRATGEAHECMRTGDWSLAEPRHFAALYALLHERVYGVEVAELTPVGRVRCAGLARKLLEREFGGDKAEMVGWAKWAWQREKGRHEWRLREGKEPSRLGWAFFWGGVLVTDWRLSCKGRYP